VSPEGDRELLGENNTTIFSTMRIYDMADMADMASTIMICCEI
jgi:hypothetical protein